MSTALKLNSFLSLKIVIQTGPHEGQRFSFFKNKITIGRSPENDIILVNDPMISRQHAYIELNKTDIEIVNLSQKNPVIINNEPIVRWKLSHNSVFKIGDSEFFIQVDGQNSVTPVEVIPKKQDIQIKKQPVQLQEAALNKPKITQPLQPQYKIEKPISNHLHYNKPTHSKVSVDGPVKNAKIRFYLILVLLIISTSYFYFNQKSEDVLKSKKSLLTYKDEVEMKLKSKNSDLEIKKIDENYKRKQSAAYLRSEENFNKGMRAFNLAKYSQAQEYFQQVLNLNSEHILAKRYLRLAQIRFDEIVSAKLDLGQAYYESNNFKLCFSQFKQAVEMLSSKEVLQGQSKDIKLEIAENMMKKCEFAIEGVR